MPVFDFTEAHPWKLSTALRAGVDIPTRDRALVSGFLERRNQQDAGQPHFDVGDRTG